MMPILAIAGDGSGNDAWLGLDEEFKQIISNWSNMWYDTRGGHGLVTFATGFLVCGIGFKVIRYLTKKKAHGSDQYVGDDDDDETDEDE